MCACICQDSVLAGLKALVCSSVSVVVKGSLNGPLDCFDTLLHLPMTHQTLSAFSLHLPSTADHLLSGPADPLLSICVGIARPTNDLQRGREITLSQLYMPPG